MRRGKEGKIWIRDILREILDGHEVDIRKGSILYVGCVDTYTATKNYDNLDDCLNAARKMVTNMPEWFRKVIAQ